MTLNKCSYDDCDRVLRSKKHARNHYQKHHSGEIETPEEYLERVESEQRDFGGEVPSTEGHDPEYEVTNDPDTGYMSTLRDYETEDDDE